MASSNISNISTMSSSMSSTSIDVMTANTQSFMGVVIDPENGPTNPKIKKH